MKILYHSWEYGPGTGGIGQYFYQMAQGVKEHGHEIVVVAGKRNNEPEVEQTDYGTVYRLYQQFDIRREEIAKRVLEIADKHDVDVIEGADHQGECARILSQTARPVVVIKYHGCQIIKALTSAEVIYPWQRFTVAAALWRIRSQRKAEKQCVENADAAMAPSEKIKSDLLSQHTSIPSRFNLIPNMLSACPDLTMAQEASVPTILYVGRIEIRKGIQYLPEIFRKVKNQFPNAVLEIAGGDQYARGLGSLKNWLQRKLGGYSDSVRFLGPLPPRLLDAAYRRCWVMVFPTKWDNFPMAVLEAMALGKPVVTTPHGGMPEMLAGTGAPIADPGSKEFSELLIQLLSDSQKRFEVGARSHQRVRENYTPVHVVPDYLRFIGSVI